MAQKHELIKGGVVYTVEDHKVIDWNIIRVNKMSIRGKNNSGEIRTIHNEYFFVTYPKRNLISQINL